MWNFFFLLFWPSLAPHPEKPFLAVHRCTAGNPVKSYAGNFGKLLNRRERRRRKNPTSIHTKRTCLFSSLPSVRKGQSPAREACGCPDVTLARPAASLLPCVFRSSVRH